MSLRRKGKCMNWCVYILRCNDDTLYTGITNDMGARLQAHEAGSGAKYTRGRGPFEIMFNEAHADRASASRREYEIKAMNRIQKDALINVQKVQGS